MTSTSSKKERVTWRDWQPPGTPDPDELLTREELVARMNDLAIDVDATDLRYWEGLGVLPRGVRKRIDKATYVFYPRWLMQSVELLRRLQAIGLSLEEIAPRLRETAADAVQVANETADKPLRVSRPGQPAVSTRGDVVLVNYARKLVEDTLLLKLTELARFYNADGVRVEWFSLNDGKKTVVRENEVLVMDAS